MYNIDKPEEVSDLLGTLPLHTESVRERQNAPEDTPCYGQQTVAARRSRALQLQVSARGLFRDDSVHSVEVSTCGVAAVETAAQKVVHMADYCTDGAARATTPRRAGLRVDLTSV